MKTIRNLMILSGLCLVLSALAVTGAKAQTLSSTNFRGTFTLPVETHWGAMILPAGDYSLEYGTLFGGSYLVTVTGEARKSPHGMILPWGRDDVKAAENGLNCIRNGDILYVRSLELPDLGEAVRFKVPHGVEVESRVIAKNHSQSGKTQFTQVAIRIDRAPVK